MLRLTDVSCRLHFSTFSYFRRSCLSRYCTRARARSEVTGVVNINIGPPQLAHRLASNMEIRKRISSARGPYRAGYSHDDLQNAYISVLEENIPVQQAATRWGVPITTLKDRVKGRIHVDTVKSGNVTLFSQEEESLLVSHIRVMSEIGYGYTRQETVNLATDYAHHLGHRNRTTPLSLRWLYSFLSRWPEIRVQKPRKLEYARARSATRQSVDNYFAELGKIMKRYRFQDRPQDIFNIDEKGLQTDITPPKVISSSNFKPQAVTSGKSKTVTLIGAVSATGNPIPPFFIFPGQRMREELLAGASPGVDGTVSEMGWSNTDIFNSYMESHFVKHVARGNVESPLLVLYDGHKSHVSLGLIQWAKKHHIVLFVLPPHTSHLLQPLDIGCYGPVEAGWTSACHKFLRESGGKAITRYDVCQIACKVLASALTPHNIISSFRRSGIFPFDPDVVTDEAVAPSLTFKPTKVTEVSSDMTDARDFLGKRGGEILANVETAKVRKTVSKIVGGKPITDDDVTSKLINHHEEQNKKKATKATGNSVQKKQDKVTDSNQKRKGNSKVNKSKGKNIVHNIPSSDETDTEQSTDTEDEKCCVCGKFTPTDLRKCASLTFVKWAECVTCGHWVHLKFCTSVTSVRRHAVFFCPHCLPASAEE